MGTWHTLEEYKQYFDAHVSRADRNELLHPPGKLFDEKHDSIVVGFEPMPEWMNHIDFISIDRSAVEFKRLQGVYRADRDIYQKEVIDIIRVQIAARLTGTKLLDELQATGQRLVIVPFHGKRQNADAGSSGRIGDINATARGVPVDYRVESRTLDPRALSIGTGHGATSTIHFSPDMWPGTDKDHPGYLPDEVLCHEMVHSSRIMRGVADSKPVNAAYDDQEEYIAIVVANMYLAEKGQRNFVSNHGGVYKSNGKWLYDDPANGVPRRANLELTGIDAKLFLRNVQHVNLSPKNLLDMFRWSQPNFYFALASLPEGRPPSQYNWVKQHRDEARGSFRM